MFIWLISGPIVIFFASSSGLKFCEIFVIFCVSLCVSLYFPVFIHSASSIALSSSLRDIGSILSKCTESYATSRGLLSIKTPPSYSSALIRVIGAAPVFFVVLNISMFLFSALAAKIRQ